MKRSTELGTIWVAVGVAAAAAPVRPVIAQSPDIHGAVTFKNDAVIPKGHLEITLEDPAVRDPARRHAATKRISSDGGSKAIAFSVTLPASAIASPTLRIVARLERADGWLLARGSARTRAGSPVYVTLDAVMY